MKGIFMKKFLNKKILKKLKSAKRLMCLLTAVTVVLSSGCGGQANSGGSGFGENGAQGSNPSGNVSGEGGREDQQEVSMGRYVEEETDLSDALEVVYDLRMLPEGKLVIADGYRSFQVSEDQGGTWKAESIQWLEEKGASAYMLNVQVGADGTLAAIYVDEDEANGYGADTDGEDEADEEASDESGEESTGSWFELNPDCALLFPDGTELPVTYSVGEDDLYPTNFWLADSGRVFMTTYRECVYEVKEDGSTEIYLNTETNPQLIQFLGDLMIIDGYDIEAPILYDMEKKEYVEDQVLAEFVKENYPDRQFNGGSWYDLFLFPGEEGTLYLAGKKGLHRYVMGQGEVEQLIDGSLSRLGSPRYGIKDMLRLETGEFIALFSGGKVVKFTYDSNVASVPTEKLKVYSLKESYDIRVAASAYQVENPEVHVEYEVGMEEGGGVTREDALKKLNTEIMAGQGPDVLVLDGLPIDSYLQKGLLLNLNEFVGKYEEELFTNLIRALGTEEEIYMIPAQVAFPILLGKEELVSGMKGLSAIAEGMEQLRRDNPGADLIGISSEIGVMKMFAAVSAPAWKGDGGEIDREALSEFLTQTKRIYEAQMDGINAKSLERFQSSAEISARDYGEDWEYELSFYGGMSLDYVGDYVKLLTGLNTYPYGYYDLTSVHKAKGCEDAALTLMEGQSKGVFIPETLLGINAASGRKELAEDFLTLFLGKENQCALGGYSINRSALEELFRPDEEYVGEDGLYGSMVMVSEEGIETELDVYVPTEEELAVFYGWMESADTPYIEDRVLEKAVMEEGQKYFRGEQELEEALDAIEQKLAIYMAE